MNLGTKIIEKINKELYLEITYKSPSPDSDLAEEQKLEEVQLNSEYVGVEEVKFCSV